MQTSQVWLRDCTMVGALPLLLFGGEVRRQAGAGAGRVAIDGWLLLDCQPKVAVLLAELRARLDRLLQVRLPPRRSHVCASLWCMMSCMRWVLGVVLPGGHGDAPAVRGERRAPRCPARRSDSERSMR